MTDAAAIIVAGSTAAVALFLLQQNPQTRPGVTGSTDEDIKHGGTLVPNTSVNPSPSEVDDLDKLDRGIGTVEMEDDYAYQQWMNRAGFIEYNAWRKSKGLADGPEAERMFWLKNRKPRKLAGELTRNIRNVHKINQINQITTTQNVFQPWRNRALRESGNMRPQIPGFIGPYAQIGSARSTVEASPYAYYNCKPIIVPYERDMRGFRAGVGNPVKVDYGVESGVFAPSRLLNATPRQLKVDGRKLRPRSIVSKF